MYGSKNIENESQMSIKVKTLQKQSVKNFKTVGGGYGTSRESFTSVDI